MLYRVLADVVLVLHLLFVAFVVAGGLSVLRWPWMAWLHLPALAWGATVEFTGWICPLTPLENLLRRSGGEAGYQGGFIEHYLMPVLYPAGLTRDTQLLLGLGLAGVNLIVYLLVFIRRRSP